MSSALIVVEPALPAIIQAEADAARAFGLAEKSEATRAAYKNDFRHFTNWCGDRGVSPMPASPELCAMYLAHLATSGAKASTIGRRAAALRYAHRLAGFKEPPTNSEQVRTVLRGIRREIGTAKTQKSPATHDLIGAMLEAIPDTLIGLRDRALLALGFATACRRSELVALTVEDLTESPDGYRVTIRKSKTDQEGQGAEVAVPRGCRICPVETVRAWLVASGITTGPVFRPVSKGGCVSPEGLSSHAVADIIKSRAKVAGLLWALVKVRLPYFRSREWCGRVQDDGGLPS